MTRRTAQAGPEPEAITLAAACRRIGISVPTATKLLEASPADFPPAFWIGGRRYVSRRGVDAWLARKTGAHVPSAA